MRRAAVALALLVLVVCLEGTSGQEPAAALTGREVMATVQYSVVPLQWETDHGTLETYCSAIVLTPITVLIAEHCTRDEPPRIWVDDVPIVWTSQASVGMQVARAVLPGSGWVPIRVRREAIREGEVVYGVGYAFGDSHITITRGIVAHVLAFDEDHSRDHLKDETWFDLTLIPGMSGGAIVDEYGRLVSVNQGLYSPVAGSALSHGPQMNAVQALIKRHR